MLLASDHTFCYRSLRPCCGHRTCSPTELMRGNLSRLGQLCRVYAELVSFLVWGVFVSYEAPDHCSRAQVHRERYVGEYNGGKDLCGCGGGMSPFATQACAAARQCSTSCTLR